ncbi:MAG TPA: helix-turn-helix domain-containing protein, partial [Albitalea sp.]
RLGLSARLLVQTQQPPAQIAYFCGFADQGHFNREFKRLSALTPGQYRHEFAATQKASPAVVQ